MGQIVVNGVKFNIQGDQPTQQDFEAIADFFRQQQSIPEAAPEPGIADKALTFAKDVAGGVSDLFTGDATRGFDYPELPEFFTGKGLSRARLALSRNDLGKLDILRSDLGYNIPAQADDFGNIFVQVGDRDADIINQKSGQNVIEPGNYYVNRPGASAQDAADLGTAAGIEAALIAPAVRGASVLGGLGRTVAGGLAASSGSILQDQAATAAGSQQGIDRQAAAIAGLFGGGGQLVSEIAAPVLRRLFAGNVFKDGKLTSKARTVLQNMGVDLDQITPDFVAQFRAAQKQGATSEQAARLGEAQTLPVPVPLTRGDITRSTADQSFEIEAARGAFGPRVQQVADEAEQAKQDALRANVDQLRTAGGTQQPLAPGEALTNIQNQLAKDAETLKQTAQSLYRKSEGRTEVPAALFDDFLTSATNSARANLDSGSFNQFQNRVNQVRKFVLPEGAADEFVPMDVLNREYQAFSQFSQQAFKAGKNKLGAAYKDMRDRYVQFTTEAVDRALIRGDADALADFKKATALWKELSVKYRNKESLVRDLIAKNADGDFVLEADAAARKLFTASGIGFKAGAAATAKQIKKLVSEPNFQALKQEAVNRLLLSQPKTGLDAAGQLPFNGNAFAKSLNDALRQSPELMEVLFTKAELAELTKFARVAVAATDKRATTRNPGTAATISAIMQRFVGGPAGQLLLGLVRRGTQKIANFADETSMRDAAAGRISQNLPVGVGLTAPAAAGGAIAVENTPEAQAARLQQRMAQ